MAIVVIISFIVAILAVVVAVVGYIVATVGLWKSYVKNAFDRVVYLGLALVATSAILFSLSGPILVGGALIDTAFNESGSEASVSEEY